MRSHERHDLRANQRSADLRVGFFRSSVVGRSSALCAAVFKMMFDVSPGIVQKVTMRSGLTSQQRRATKAIVAGLMLALWFVISGVAATPELHHWLHKDSKTPTHQCLFTELGKGSLLAGFGSVVITTPALSFVHLSCCAEFQYSPVSDYLVSPSRAPPSVSSSSMVVG